MLLAPLLGHVLACRYFVETGSTSCEGGGGATIRDSATCLTAAKGLGLVDANLLSATTEQDVLANPMGCYADTNTLHFNTRLLHDPPFCQGSGQTACTGSCTDPSSSCVCATLDCQSSPVPSVTKGPLADPPRETDVENDTGYVNLLRRKRTVTGISLESTEALLATAVVTGITTGISSETAGQTAMLVLLMDGRCGHGEKQVSRALWPLSILGLASIAGSSDIAALVGNTSIVVGVSALTFCFVLLLTLLSPHLPPAMRTGSCLKAQGVFRFPSMPLFLVLILFQGTVMAATRLLLRHENVPFCIVGILAVMCLVSVPVVLGVYIRRSIPAKAFHKRELVNPRQFRRVHKLLIRVLAFVTGTGEWVSRSEDDPWVTRHLAMVKPFRQGAASFVCFELLAMGLLAFASACRTGSLVACGHVKATSAIVCFAGCTLRLKMHPSAYPRDDYIEPFRLSVQSTALVLQAVGFYSENEDHRAFSIATPLFGVAMGLFGLKILLDVITFLATSDRVTVLQEQAYAKVDWDAELLELDVSPDFSDGKVDPQGGCRTRGSSDAARGVDLRNVSFQLPGPAHAGRGLTPPSSALSSPSSLKLSTGTSPAMRPQQVYRTSDVVSAASPSPPCKDDGSVEFELLFDNNSPALIPCEFQTTHRRRSRWSITPPGNESIFSSTLDKTVLPLMNHTPSHSSQFLQSSDSGSMTGRGHRSGSVPTCDQRSLPAIRRVLLEPGVEDRLDDTLLSSIHSFDRRSSLSVSSIHRRIALGPRAATPDTRSLSATRRTRSDSLTRPAALISKKTSSSITFI